MTSTACPDVKPNAAPGVRLVGSMNRMWDVDRQCAALGLAPHSASPPDDADAEEPTLLLAGPATIETIRHSLAPPYAGFLEIGSDGLAGIGQRCIETVRAGGMALSLTATSACTVPLVELIAVAIRRRLALANGENAELMEICLAEAVSNAIIHGNLEIPNHLRATPKGFDTFRQVMRERLSDPVMASRRIEIHVLARQPGSFTLAVSDQGPGFNLAAQIKKEARADARSGRGLGLIRRACATIESEDGGRTLVMTFPWESATEGS
jgi:anti-sigma regulatory factor (Ser/Thr protein kinase)